MSLDRRPVALGVRVRTAEGASDYSLDLADTAVTLAEVFDALGLPPHTAVDGTVFPRPDRTAAETALVAGSLLEPARTEAPEAGSDPRRVAAPTVEVSIVAGPDAGHVAVVPAGTYRLAAGCPGDSSADGAEWLLQIPPSGPGAATAPWHEHAASIEVLDEPSGIVAIGSPIDPEEGTGRTLQRPPRPIPPSSVLPIPLVEPPPQVREPSPLSWATLLAPVPIALLMAFFFRPIFALFAAMGPVMALGRWYESRRRYRRESTARRQVIAGLRAEVDAAVVVQREALAQVRWSSNPHVAELYRRARVGSVRLWERRRDAPGFLEVVVGVGPDRVPPVLAEGRLHDELHAVLGEPLGIRAVPHTVSLSAGGGLGVHGNDRSIVLATVRSVLLQMATLHGPADLVIGIVCRPTVAGDWDWLKWLPHHNRSLTAHSAARPAAVLEQDCGSPSVRSEPTREESGATHLILVDDPAADVALLTAAARRSGVELRVISVAADARSLPAACDTLVETTAGRCDVTTPHSGRRRSAGHASGVSVDTAERWARSLSGRIDPERQGRRLDALDALGSVGLRELVGFESADGLADQWRSRARGAAPVAAVGVGADGPVTIDLTTDGPHALIAGTTGSGKSELLRTLVVSLAVACPPSEVNFVLIDFKGGGAFDALGRLPHVAGLITDLDDMLVERALTGLRAELLRRERLLRSLGVSTFDEAAACAQISIARLVVVIDEFAALATDHPELMASVIDLASRGRSLGMHVVLATQRPSGVVDQKIRANTNLRIALRVQDAFDSQDVVGVADASRIDRRHPGRAYIRVGADAPVPVQVASSAAGWSATGARCAAHHLALFGPEPGAAEATPLPVRGPSPLDVLVDVVVAVSNTMDYAAARALWSDPLPDSLDRIDLVARELHHGADAPSSDAVVLGLADVPEQQAHAHWRWRPDTGPLVVYGASSGCAAKVMLSLGTALGSVGKRASVASHVYVVDGGTGELEALAGLAHVGAYMSVEDHDRIDRAVAMFEQAIARPELRGGHSPRLFLVIDNLAAVLGARDESGAASLVDRLSAVARDGLARGAHVVLTARSVRDVPHRLAQQLSNRLVMALADPSGYLALGMRARHVPTLPPMRAVDIATNRLVQLVEPPTQPDPFDESDACERLAEPIRGFPDSVCSSDLPGATLADGLLRIPIGVEARELGIVDICLPPRRHALVIGPPGSGRSTLLDTIAGRFGDDTSGIRVIRIARDAPTAQDIGRLVDEDEPILAIVDDAESVDPDVVESLERLLDTNLARVVAATTPDAARSMRSWMAPIRAGGVGVLLGRCAADGDLLGSRREQIDGLGRIPGRGLLVAGGRAVMVQVADANAATDPVWLL